MFHDWFAVRAAWNHLHIAGAVADQGDALSMPFDGPGQLAIDREGNLYVSDLYSIVKIDNKGRATRLLHHNSGSSSCSYSLHPAGNGIAVEPGGAPIFSDANCGVLYRIVSPDRADPLFGGSTDSGRFAGLFVDSTGVIYATQTASHQVIGIDSVGNRRILAGTGSPGYRGEGGPATDAQLNAPSGVVLDAGGNVYFADGGNFRIRKITPDGVIQTIAGTGEKGFDDADLAIKARMGRPGQLAMDANGDVLFVDLDTKG